VAARAGAHRAGPATRPAVNLRPSADWPDRAVGAVDLARVRAVIDRIAADIDELARARRVQDLNIAAVLPDRRADRRWRLAGPDLEFRAFCARKELPASSTLQLERAWDAWQAEFHERTARTISGAFKRGWRYRSCQMNRGDCLGEVTHLAN